MSDRSCKTCAYSDMDGRPILGVHRCRVCHDDPEHPRWEPDAAFEVPGAAQSVEEIMKERDELRRQLAMADEESNMLAEAIAHAKWCNEQLAAAQAREARKNYALRQISLRPWHSQVGAIAEDALNLPSEDAALREMIAEAVAQEREACAETATDVAPGRDADAIADAIRARSQQ